MAALESGVKVGRTGDPPVTDQTTATVCSRHPPMTDSTGVAKLAMLAAVEFGDATDRNCSLFVPFYTSRSRLSCDFAFDLAFCSVLRADRFDHAGVPGHQGAGDRISALAAWIMAAISR